MNNEQDTSTNGTPVVDESLKIAESASVEADKEAGPTGVLPGEPMMIDSPLEYLESKLSIADAGPLSLTNTNDVLPNIQPGLLITLQNPLQASAQTTSAPLVVPLAAPMPTAANAGEAPHGFNPNYRIGGIPQPIVMPATPPTLPELPPGTKAPAGRRLPTPYERQMFGDMYRPKATHPERHS